MKINSNYAISVLILLMVYSLLFFYFDPIIAYSMKGLKDSWLYDLSQRTTEIVYPKAWLAASILGIALSALAHYLYGKKRWVLNIYSISLSVLLANWVGESLKIVLSRYRPEMLFQKGLYGFSFFSWDSAAHSSPSGHALSAFAIATSLSYLKPRYSPLFFLGAVFLGFTRIVLERHYLGDILLGAYLGTTITILVFNYFTKTYTE